MFNPSLHTATNKPIGLTNKPVDARTYYYDEVNFVYRQYVSTAEVLAYLAANQRVGQFSIIINTGGTIITDGTITGGVNSEWWFKNGILEANLIIKGGSGDVFASPIPLPAYPIGTSLPITISSFASTYAAYGDYPGILVLNATTGDEITNPTINRNPITAPNIVTINAADDGTGLTDSELIIVIKK